MIAVIASFAEDHIDFNKTPEIRRGGPALFITQALERLHTPYQLFSGKYPAEVNIRMIDGEEVGTINRADPIEISISHEFQTYIISTLLNEFPLERVIELSGFVAVDMQGYVRRPGGGRRIYPVTSRIAEKLSCVKVAHRELPYLEPSFVESQKQRILIVTRGARDVTFWVEGKESQVSVEKSVKIRNTIGAGDIFLASFTVAIMRGLTVKDAVLFARDEVYSFLEARKKEES